ncbi:MAG TPA: MarR family transcriptional regulator [Gemmatimonadota bacterium]|nr:MarR family transcriptional regulator [Gemmatimonadota bacterium]
MVDSSLPREAACRFAESPLAEKLGPVLLVLGRLVGRRLEQALAAAGLGITPAQARVLVMLHFHDTLNQQALAAVTDVEPSTLVRTLDVLEREGLVVRERDPADRRAYQVRLTPAGQARVPRLFALWDQVEKDLSEGLEEKDQRALRELLEPLIERMSTGETPCG